MKLARHYITAVSVIAAISVPIVLASLAPQPVPLFNSDKSVTVFPAGRSVQCSDYSSGAVVREMATDALEAAGTLTGPDSPLDDDADGETTTYAAMLTNGKVTKITSFESSAPINYLLLKGSEEVMFYLYKTGGERIDGNLALASGGPISAISLCYGIPAAARPPPAVSLPDCEDKGTIDGTSVGCPTDGSETVVCNLEVRDENLGLGNEGCCICNHSTDAFRECDPNIDPSPFQLGACPILAQPTAIIEVAGGGGLTCIYTTVLGKRTGFCQAAGTGAGTTCVLRTILGKRTRICP